MAARRLAARLPAPAKRLVQLGLSVVDPLLIARHRRRTGERAPIPPVALRARVGGPSIDVYLRTRESTATLVEAALAEAGRPLDGLPTALDLGCGCGRTLAPLAARHPDVAFHGCDIDAPAIAWLTRHHPEVTAVVNDFAPPLPYPDDAFALVYSISLFTHLDEPRQAAWMRELRRVLAPGGVAVVTVHAPAALAAFAAGDSPTAIPPARIARHAPLAAGGFAYEPVPPSRWNALRFIDAGAGWGLSFHSPGWIREHWGPLFDSVRVLEWPGAWQYPVVLEAADPRVGAGPE